jgi:hypothetical protein
MKVEFDVDEAWTLMSFVVACLLDETDLPDEDRARIRRWRSERMRPTEEVMKTLARKMNEDLAHALEVKRRSHIRKPDWR